MNSAHFRKLRRQFEHENKPFEANRVRVLRSEHAKYRREVKRFGRRKAKQQRRERRDL